MDTQTILDRPVQTSAMTNLYQEFMLDSPLFGKSDVQDILQKGLVTWAIEQGDAIIWEDAVFDWREYPMLFRQALVSDLAAWLDSEFQYLVPFRRLGRVIIVAVLPTPVKQIAVSREPARLVVQGRLDPPVPYPALGLNHKAINARYVGALKSFVLDGNRRALIQRMPMLVESWGDIGATKAEMFYLLSGIQSLISGSWRQMAEYAPVMTTGHIIQESTNRNPAFPFKFAEKMLLDRAGQLNFLSSGDDDDPDNIILRGE